MSVGGIKCRGGGGGGDWGGGSEIRGVNVATWIGIADLY